MPLLVLDSFWSANGGFEQPVFIYTPRHLTQSEERRGGQDDVDIGTIWQGLRYGRYANDDEGIELKHFVKKKQCEGSR